MTDRPTDRTFFQNAWVVENLEDACQRWVDEFGVGPFFVTDYVPGTFDEVTYRGRSADLSMRVALAQAGPVQIELIEPRSEVCAYRDSVAAGAPPTFHHMCVWTHDIEADTQYFADLDYPVANRGTVGNAEFAYYDTRPLLGCMLEVVTKNDNIVARFAEIAAAAQGWDGQRPIRA